MKKLTMMLILFVSVFFTINASIDAGAAEDITVNTINSAIVKKGGRWTAGQTSVSLLSVDDRRALLGLKKRDLENYLPGSGKFRAKTQASYPAVLDWRNNDGGDWTTPIRNQGSCGSCWAFGSLAVVESLMEIKSVDPSLDPDYSEQFMVSCSGGSCDGWYMDDTAEFLKNTGSTDEPCFPYVAQDRPCYKRCPDWESRIVNISDWGWVGGSPYPATVDEIKEELQYGPVFGSMTVYEDFFYYTGGVYEHVYGQELGGHAIAIVGWDDINQCWICKNSWGPGWGENGWFRIKMGTNECGIEEETVWFDMQIQPACEEEDSGVLDIVGKKARPGGTVTIPVRIQGAPNDVYSLGFEVRFPDSILAFTGFTKGPLAQAFDFFDVNVPEPGVLRVGGFEAGADIIAAGAAGDLVYLEFDVNPDCDDNVKLDLQELKDDIASWSISHGCFDCTPCSCDVNGDGEVTPQDAMCAFQKYLSVCPTACGGCDDVCCDVNMDDDCTPQDALEIFKEYLGLPSVCSAETVY